MTAELTSTAAPPASGPTSSAFMDLATLMGGGEALAALMAGQTLVHRPPPPPPALPLPPAADVLVAVDAAPRPSGGAGKDSVALTAAAARELLDRVGRPNWTPPHSWLGEEGEDKDAEEGDEGAESHAGEAAASKRDAPHRFIGEPRWHNGYVIMPSHVWRPMQDLLRQAISQHWLSGVPVDGLPVGSDRRTLQFMLLRLNAQLAWYERAKATLGEEQAKALVAYLTAERQRSKPVPAAASSNHRARASAAAAEKEGKAAAASLPATGKGDAWGSLKREGKAAKPKGKGDVARKGTARKGGLPPPPPLSAAVASAAGGVNCVVV